MDTTLNCFVIGPIGDKFAPVGSAAREVYEEALDVYEKVIAPACEQNQLQALRADQIAVAGEITEQILRHLQEDPIVIADVSGGNPNVMYELGLRHSIGKPTIHLGEYGQLPFDIAGYRTILFSRSDRGLIDARKELEAAIAAALVEGAGPVTAARLWQGKSLLVENPDPSGATPEKTDGDIIPDDEPGFFEMLTEINEELPKLAETAQAIAESIEQINVVTEQSTNEMNGVSESAGTKERLGLITRYATRLSEPAESIENLTDDFVQRITRLDGSMMGLSRFLRDHPDVWDTDQVRDFYGMVSTLAQAGHEGMEGVNALAVAAEGLGAISRALRVPGRRISNSVRRMAKSVALMDDWESALAETVRQRPVDRAS